LRGLRVFSRVARGHWLLAQDGGTLAGASIFAAAAGLWAVGLAVEK
jgi:hypothetical protein